MQSGGKGHCATSCIETESQSVVKVPSVVVPCLRLMCPLMDFAMGFQVK